jgi:hypothetical protein
LGGGKRLGPVTRQTRAVGQEADRARTNSRKRNDIYENNPHGQAGRQLRRALGTRTDACPASEIGAVDKMQTTRSTTE